MFKKIILILNFSQFFTISPVLFFSSEDGLCVRKPISFPTDRFPKNTGIIHFCATGLEGGLCSTLVDFFHQIKVHQPNRKKGFYTGRLQKNEEIRGIFVLSSKEP
jgi:hypothetical protein